MIEALWQLIDDTARNGGEWLLLVDGKYRHVGWFDGKLWHWNGHRHGEAKLTAYMPLPPLPEASPPW